MSRRYVLVRLDDPMHRLGDELPEAAEFVTNRLNGYGPGVAAADVTDWLGRSAADLLLDKAGPS